MKKKGEAKLNKGTYIKEENMMMAMKMRREKGRERKGGYY